MVLTRDCVFPGERGMSPRRRVMLLCGRGSALGEEALGSTLDAYLSEVLDEELFRKLFIWLSFTEDGVSRTGPEPLPMRVSRRVQLAAPHTPDL